MQADANREYRAILMVEASLAEVRGTGNERILKRVQRELRERRRNLRRLEGQLETMKPNPKHGPVKRWVKPKAENV